MIRLAGAAACVLLTLSAAAAKPRAEPARMAGIVVKASSKIAPSPDGPVFREGRLTIADKAGREEALKAVPRTKITLDGKDAKFKAATPGTIVLRALYDPGTKLLSALDLKSAAPASAATEAPGQEKGEIVETDVLKGLLFIRTGSRRTRQYAMTDQTAIVDKDGKPLAFEALAVGDAVSVDSNDGKSAAEVRVFVAP